MYRSGIILFALAILPGASLEAACIREPVIAYPYGMAGVPAGGHAGVAYLYYSLGGIPARPVAMEPADGTVLDGGSLHTGKIVRAPDQSGGSVREPLVFSWKRSLKLPTVLYAPFRVMADVPDTTHHRICAFEAANEADCDSAAPPPDRKGFVLYEARCEASPSFSPPNGSLVGFAPGSDTRVTELFWKVRACNRNRQVCSDWSEKKAMKWLPAPVLISENNSTPRGSSRQRTPKLVASMVQGRDKTHFCIAQPGDRCPERANFNSNSNASPLVRNTEDHNEAAGEEALWPQLDFDGSHNPIDLQSWFDNQTVNWTASTCLRLPASNELGCVYQEQTRSVSFPP